MSKLRSLDIKGKMVTAIVVTAVFIRGPRAGPVGHGSSPLQPRTHGGVTASKSQGLVFTAAPQEAITAPLNSQVINMARKDSKNDLEMNTQTDETTSTRAEGQALREDAYTLLCDFNDELLEQIDELETHQGNER